MPIDYSKMSDAELEALSQGNMQGLSDNTLQMLSGSQQSPAQDNMPREKIENSNFGGTAGDILMHGLAGAATSGRNLLNTAQDSLRGLGLSDVIGKVPGLKNISRGENDRNFDYYKSLGLNENLADKLGTGLLDYAPYGMGAAKAVKGIGQAVPRAGEFLASHPKTGMLLENVLGGGTAGGANDGLSGALMGGAMGAGASALGAAANPLAQFMAKKYAQSAIPEFTKTATDKIKSLFPVSEYADKLLQKHNKIFGENKSNWENLTGMTEGLDKSIGNKFDNRPYHDYIDTHVKNVGKLDPAQKEQYAQSLKLAEKAKEIAPESFSGLVSSRQNINSVLKDFLDPTGMTKTNKYSKDFITGLKNNLKNDTLKANEGKIDPEVLKNFKSQWENANKSHQSLQDFYKSMQSTTGVIKPNKQTRDMYEQAKNTGSLDPAIFNKYAPPLSLKGSQGIEGINQLEKIFGSKELAQDALKSSLFRRPTSQGASTIDSAKIYSDMSPQQQKALFGNSKEGKMLDAINNARVQFGREPEKTSEGMGIGRHIASMGPAALLGTGAGLASGESWDKAMLTGVGAGLGAKGLQWMAGKTATPEMVNRAIKIGKNGVSPSVSRYLNLLMQSGEGNK